MSAVRRVLAGVIPVSLAVLDAASAGAQVLTFRACRVPNVGAIYMIGVPGVPSACLDPSHIEFTWTEGGPPPDASVTTAKLADGSVTSPKIADGAVTSATLADGSVTNAKLGTNAVSLSKILDGSVSTGKIQDGAVTTSKIPDRSIPIQKLTNVVGMYTTTVGWGNNVPCGTSWVGGAGTLPGALPGDVVVMTDLHPHVMSPWASHKAYVASAGVIGVRLTIQATGCPGPATVGGVPVLIIVYRP